jgi:hypothetical protein
LETSPANEFILLKNDPTSSQPELSQQTRTIRKLEQKLTTTTKNLNVAQQELKKARQVNLTDKDKNKDRKITELEGVIAQRISENSRLGDQLADTKKKQLDNRTTDLETAQAENSRLNKIINDFNDRLKSQNQRSCCGD